MKPRTSKETEVVSSGSRLFANSAREEMVVDALKECQQYMDAGEPIDRPAMLEKYAEIREELSACLDGLELMMPSPAALSVGSSGKRPPAAMHDATPPTTLGDFRIIREIGKGGMGVVYEAEQLSVGRSVALKVLPYAAMLDRRQVARFQNEARAAATLEHPRIVPVYFVGNERGVYYYAMKLIDGSNLSEVITEIRQSNGASAQRDAIHLKSPQSTSWQVDRNREPGHSENASTIGNSGVSQPTSLASGEGVHSTSYFRTVASLGAQIADALDFAHGHGILHRDVKPANIMLDEVGDAWITDFGLARIEADSGMTMTGDVLGTLRYMSPEQTRERSAVVDHRSDIYALGATLYELTTLQPVFDAADRAELLRKIANELPKPMSKYAPKVPREFETIVLKALQKRPEERYDTAHDFAADLNRFLSHQPVHARRTPITQRVRMWGRRHPTLVASSLLVFSVALICIAAVGWLVAKYERDAVRVQELATAKVELALEEKNRALNRATTNLGLAAEHEARANREAEAANRARLAAEAYAEHLQQQVYVREMQQAYAAMNSGWTSEVVELLTEQIPREGRSDFRGFEWHVLNELVRQPPPVELLGHNGPVRDLAVFDGQSRLASVGDDGTIRIWDLVRNAEQSRMGDATVASQWGDRLSGLLGPLQRLPGLSMHSRGRALRSLAVSPDGKRLATGNTVLSLWDLQQERHIRTLSLFPTRIFGIAFSPDGRQVAAQSADEEIRLMDLDAESVLANVTSAGAYRISFSPDGSRLFVPFQRETAEGRVRGLRSLSVEMWDDPVDYPLPSMPRGIAVSRDGRHLFCGTSNARALVLDLRTGNVLLQTAMLRAGCNDLALAPDESAFAVAHKDGTIALTTLPRRWQQRDDDWRTSTKIIPVHDGPVNAVQYLDANRLASCGDDGVIRISQVNENQTKRILSEDSYVKRCAYLPNGKRLLLTTKLGLQIYDTLTDELVDAVQFRYADDSPSGTREVMSLAIDPSGRLVALGDDSAGLVIYDLENGREVKRFKQTDIRVSAIADVAFSPDGKWLAIGSRDHTVRIRAVSDWAEVHRISTGGWGTNVEFSPDGRLLAYADSDGAFSIIETDTWTRLAEAQASSGCQNDALRFSRDGSQVISGHNDASLQVWSTANLDSIDVLVGHDRPVTAISMHPDGTTFSTTSSDGTVRLWHLPTRTQIGVLGSWGQIASCCCFAPDGSQLAAVSVGREQGECQLWDLSAESSRQLADGRNVP